jgi:mercuric ion transport protein
MKSNKKLIGTGVFTAITASLCCIAPIAAIFAGTSSFATTFSFLEPLRPYLIGVTIVVLGFAWFQNLKKVEEVDCDCEEDAKPKFIQSKKFLGIITMLAVVFLSFPYYSHHLIPEAKKTETLFDNSHFSIVSLNVEGMTCSGCEQHITHEVNQLSGVSAASASYQEGNATIEFDESKTSIDKIVQAINSTGYTVTQPSNL